MTQPVWITPAGNLGVIPVGVFFQLTLQGELPGEPDAELYYEVIAGRLPDGIQCAKNGTLAGTPDAVASLQGVPLEVGRDTTSKFTVRLYPENDPTNIRDRTFSITIAVIPEPLWITPPGLVASYYDSDAVDFQFQFEEVYTPDTTVVTLAAGTLPGGLRLGLDGRLTGYVQPSPNLDAVAGYDISAQDADPYDFLSQSISKNYQFTLQVSNGHASSLRQFEIFVYSRSQMQASDAVLIDNNTFVTTDETPYQAPFITNSTPSNLGTFRSNNYFAYQFVGEDYINQPITYAISVNQGAGFAPGLVLDPASGWYYGYIPDQGTTETEYSFNVVVYQNEYITPAITITQTVAATGRITANYITNTLEQGWPIRLTSNFGGLTAGTLYYIDTIVSQTAVWNIAQDKIVSYNTVFTVIRADSSVPTLTNATGAVEATLVVECTATDSLTKRITCSSTANLGIGQPLIFTGTGFGGITAAAQTIYYVVEITNDHQFKVSDNPNSSTPITLLDASGSMIANLILASDAYPFSLTITGAVEAEVTWNTPSYLGDIINGAISMFKVSATNRGGRTMRYRLKSGAYNSLPQGLQLMPSGDIVGRVSFDTFALDLGATTFDQSFAINRNVASLGTTFDQTFVFTVNAYAEDTNQIIYEVDSIQVDNGGTGYSNFNKPTIAIGAPVGASAVPAQAGVVTVVGGAITSVTIPANGHGNGYTSVPTVTITQGFGGAGAQLTAVMAPTGSRDVISVYKTFEIHVIREYNRPYQNLFVRAMPPPNDRALIRSLLDNEEIFPPKYLYRADDSNFGKSTQVTYAHAFGLAPDTLERYVASLYENHYWKNLILGQIETAQALDPITGEVVYEVVYSKIIDNLVNDAGESVNKIVTLPYAIVDPADGSTIITSVYPNSLVNMRNQVIDVVGQISNTLPLWMTSKQPNGRVLGFTPAWVIAYVNPGRSKEIVYFIQTYFAQQLNSVDFKVDRYILDRMLSKNWDVDTQHWVPRPPTLTTFDRFSTADKTFIGTVDISTNLAWSDVNNRSLAYIDELGGLDGIINNVEGKTIIFANQEEYYGPPGSSYANITDAWQTWQAPSGGVAGIPATYFAASSLDASTIVPNGESLICTATSAVSNTITTSSTANMVSGQQVVFTANIIGGLSLDVIYYVLDIPDSTHFSITATAGSTAPVTLTTAVGTMEAQTADQRMAIYTIHIDPVSKCLQLTLTTQTQENDYVQVVEGDFYRSAYLYYPTIPGDGLTQISWLPLVTIGVSPPLQVDTRYEILSVGNTNWVSLGASANQVGVIFTATATGVAGTTGTCRSIETVFDGNSLKFIAPVDMYNPTDIYDKYLVFPKSNILV
jgi:hypothetical protein